MSVAFSHHLFFKYVIIKDRDEISQKTFIDEYSCTVQKGCIYKINFIATRTEHLVISCTMWGLFFPHILHTLQ